MLSILLHRGSLKSRMTLFTLVIFLVSIWSLTLYVSQLLHADMMRLTGEQQFSTVAFVADEINHEFEGRVRALEKVAAHIGPLMLGHPQRQQQLMEERPALQELFNAGLVVVGPDGVALADLPRTGRRGVNYADRDFVIGALKEGRSTIGRPVMGKTSKAPVIVVSAPIRDEQGRILGALLGTTDLSQPNFLDIVTDHRYGLTGGYLLIAPSEQLIVTGTDRRRIMEQVPASLLSRFADGYEGSSVFVNPLGVEVLSSRKHIPMTDWYAVATLPTEEAFAPVRDMARRMLLAALGLSLLAGGLTWWLVRRQLAPMLGAIRTLTSLSASNQPLQPLPITRQDEVGDLIGGVNHLLAALGQREAALRESEERYRTLIEWSPEAIAVHRAGKILYVNPAAVKMAGAETARDLIGTSLLDRIHPDFRPLVMARIRHAEEQGQAVPVAEEKMLRMDGSVIDVEVQSRPIVYDGQKAVHVVMSDITERKKIEETLRVAATAFQSQQGMIVTDANNVILRVNDAFSRITGYSAQEVVGRTPRMLNSGRHDAAFYAALWASLHSTGAWQGEIWNRRKSGEIFPEQLSISVVRDGAGKVSHHVGTFADISLNKAAEEKITQLAFYDPLTGLPNRRLLMDRLNHALATNARHHGNGALMFIDLDNFKIINDTLGHINGDLLLQLVAKRLLACMREKDTVARLGGDEFVVLLENLSANELEAISQAEAVGKKILAALNQPYQLGIQEPHCTPSIGITLFDGIQHETIDEPMKRADLAMYQAKAAGRNTLRFFDPQMQSVVTARAELESGLREALAGQQFSLHYQAQMTRSGQLVGVEALVRWHHPQHGTVSPATFIPLAEETGLILPLGEWVLDAACHQLAAWATQPEMAHLTIAVNVSARQLHQPDFVDQVLAALKRAGANPQRLKLELTESLLVSNVESLILKMNALKERGVDFSLDDFGTGYSSLSYLKRLPLGQLKIDQSFVRDILVDPNDAAIAKMVVALANSMGLTVIAEGVETEAQCDSLADLGCLAYQGYLFSRPLPIHEFEAYARQLLPTLAKQKLSLSQSFLEPRDRDCATIQKPRKEKNGLL